MEQGRQHELWWLLGLFLVAWFVRVAVAFDYEASHPWADRPVIDERSYEDWALTVAEGDWLGDEVFFQEPLYPYALAVVHAAAGERGEDGRLRPSRTGARHAQAFLGALGVVLVVLVARRTFGATAALVAGALGALYLPWIHGAMLFLKPNLVLPLVAALALGLGATRDGRRGAWLLLGVGGGLGALLRGNLLLLLPVLVALPWLRRDGTRTASRARRSALAALGIALVLAPVALRNLAVGGELVLTTSGAGTNVFGGNNEHNPWGRATEFPWVRGIPEHEADDWRHEAERRLGRAPLSRGEVSRFWLNEVGASLVERPAMHLAILARKAWLVLGRYETPDNHALAWDARHVRSLALPLPGWGVVGALALAGAVLAFAGGRFGVRPPLEREGARELAFFAALYAGTIVLTVVSGRIRLALVPLALPFAGYAAVALVRSLRFREGRAFVLPVVGAFAALLAVPTLPVAEREKDLAERDFNHAIYLLERDGGEVEAEGVARDLAARYPGSSRVETLLAELEARRGLAALAAGRTEGAQGLLAGALERLKRVARADGVSDRERFRSRATAGTIQAALGRHDAAERHFAAALSFDPEDVRLRLGWTRARLARLGELAVDERRPLLEELLRRASAWDDGGPAWRALLDAARALDR